MPECECGCGAVTGYARNSAPARGIRRGDPVRFSPGHNRRKTPNPYEIDDNGCWVWLRSRTSAGYGTAWDPASKRLVTAHRLYYEQARGPIPDGEHIDHLCRNRLCVNPDHLEAVSVTENNQRSFFGRREDGTFMREDESGRMNGLALMRAIADAEKRYK